MAWLRGMLACRFCRRVTGFIFLTILAVEAALLIPSYFNYERDRLMRLDDVGMTAVTGLLLAAESGGEAGNPKLLAVRWIKDTPLVGLHIIGAGNEFAIGEGVSLQPGAPASARPQRQEGGTRYDATWTIEVDGRVWQVAARLDASTVGPELFWFVIRILGLVAVIAVVVTTATLIVLSGSLIRPLLRLRDQMLLAADAPEAAKADPRSTARDDEIGEMARTFDLMTGRIAASIQDLRAHEIELAKARDAAERANAAKSTFLAAMSHELRTPLNAIIGFSDIMRNESFGPHAVPRYKDYAGDINNAGTHLLGLINDVLDLSKAEAGRLDLDETDLSLSDLMDSATRFVSGRAEDGGVALDVTAPENIVVRGDAQRLRQILLNLVSNAIKFTPHNGRVEVVAGLTGDGALQVAIADTGSGIAPDDLELVFQPFEQAGDRTIRREGTGLGLPISRRLAEAHGGHLTLSSVPGQGTTATLFLPSDRVRVIALRTPANSKP